VPAEVAAWLKNAAILSDDPAKTERPPMPSPSPMTTYSPDACLRTVISSGLRVSAF
jgi:hypothetical protein